MRDITYINRIIAQARKNRRKKMPLINNSKLYDILKWTAAIFLPALNVLWVALATVWGLGLVQEVATTIAATNAFLGALVGVSNVQYNKEKK
jgi:hypothetical protein